MVRSPAQSDTVSNFSMRRLVNVAVPHAVRQPEQSEGSFSYTALKGKMRPLGLRAPQPGMKLSFTESNGMYSS